MRKLITLSVFGFLIAACSVDSVENEDFQILDAKVANSHDESLIIPELLCVGEEAEFCLEFPTDSKGEGKNKKNVQVQRLIAGDDPETDETEDHYWYQIFHEQLDTASCFNYTFETEGEHKLRYKIGGGGYTEVTASVEDCNDCDNELTADLTCAETNTLVLTFTAEEAGEVVIQGGLNNNTRIVSKSSNILSSNEDHSSVVNSKANVTRWEGYVEACEEVVITIEFEGEGKVDDWSAQRNVEGEEEIMLGETEPKSCT